MDQTNSVTNSDTGVKNLTSLWAFSEGFLGGILNAVKIPFKGLFLGNVSVTIIIFIANFTSKKGAVLKAGTITTIVKAVISPYSGVPAYFAVFMQTLLGELFFLRRKFMTASGILLGIVTSVLSSVQRIVILTLLFGNAFWETIDQFATYTYNEFTGNKTVPGNFKFSNWLIGVYILIHAVVGFIVGLYASRYAKRMRHSDIEQKKLLEEFRKESSLKEETLIKRKNRSKLFRATRIILYLFLLAVLILSYVSSDVNGIKYFDSKSIWIMLIRSVIIMILWFKVIGPLLSGVIRKRLMKSKSKYSEEIHYTLTALPLLRQMSAFVWKKADGRGFKKILNFISLMLPVILTADLKENVP